MEPTSAESVAEWIESAKRLRDPLEHVRVASHDHRESHGAGCSVYPTASGPLLSVLAAAVGAMRIMAEYRQRVLDDEQLLTVIVPGGLALSVVRPAPNEIK